MVPLYQKQVSGSKVINRLVVRQSPPARKSLAHSNRSSSTDYSDDTGVVRQFQKHGCNFQYCRLQYSDYYCGIQSFLLTLNGMVQLLPYYLSFHPVKLFPTLNSNYTLDANS